MREHLSKTILTLSEALQEKLLRLAKFFEQKKIIVALSGGVDSAVLLLLATYYAAETKPIIIETPYIIPREISRAQMIADEVGVALEKITLPIHNIPEIYENPANRCYYCKKHILAHLLKKRDEIGYDLVVEGTQLDDLQDSRPGLQALREHSIISPFVVAQITKNDIHHLSQAFHFPAQIYPSNSCLATRVPAGIPLTTELLTLINAAEELIIEQLGTDLCNIRVRVHPLNSDSFLARIEGDPILFDYIQNPEHRKILYSRLRTLGFAKITLDLKEYNS